MDKPTPDFTLTELIDEIFLSHVYFGPGAYTAAEIQAGMKRPLGYSAVCARCRAAVEAGTLVEVKVERRDVRGGVRAYNAWVKREVYEQHQREAERPM